MTRYTLGVTASGRPITAYELRPTNIDAGQMRRLAVICRQHGDEPEATAAGAEFLFRFLTANTQRAIRWRQNVAVMLIPVANPDGAAYNRRLNGVGQDLNRDWGDSNTREVSAIAGLLGNWRPQLVVDVHQWVPGDSCQTPMAEASGGRLARTVASAMATAARARGYRLESRSYSTGGTLCHRYWGAQGVPGILLETIHRPGSPSARARAIGTSVVALQRALDVLGG